MVKQRRHLLFFLSLLCGFIPPIFPGAYASTSVGGRISAGTTWTLSGSPYIVTSSVQFYGTTGTPITLTNQE